MSIPKLGAASSPQVSQSTSSAQPSSKLQGFQGGTQSQGLEQYQGAVNDLAQHLASDRSLNPGEVRSQAEGALQELTGLEGAPLQKLVQQTADKVNEIYLSSGDRWLRGETPDTFGGGGGTITV
jgi:hypothetical protein